MYTGLVLWYDNISATALASNHAFHVRTKHIDVDYHFIQEKVVNGDFQVKHIATHDQIVDLFTKEQSAARFQFLHNKLKVCLLPINLQSWC